MNQYTSEKLSSMLKVSVRTINNIVKKHSITYTNSKRNIRIYNEESLKKISEIIYSKVEIIQVPVFIPVYYEIIHSKINFE